MIKLDELCAMLDGLGIPWTNEGYTDEDRPEPPYISLEADLGGTSYADNVAWASWMNYEILLYTTHRSYEIESKIASALDAAGCAFSETVTHVDGEHLVEASFYVSVQEE
ncbi:hypothetical protein [Olsenella sp. Marseille-P4559]|uniref:hypothetical protein n=1 Tax=Olsenella sp. Marseille-P4559 TaxID=2364795 RepID=UPI00102F9001|nr:hypothetical protein [Olsenella sp. Marseille-P4559]